MKFSLVHGSSIDELLPLLLNSGVDVNYQHACDTNQLPYDLIVAFLHPATLIDLLRYGLDTRLIFRHSSSKFRQFYEYFLQTYVRRFEKKINLFLPLIFDLVYRSPKVIDYLNIITSICQEKFGLSKEDSDCSNGEYLFIYIFKKQKPVIR